MGVLFNILCAAVSALPLSLALALGRGVGWVYGSVVRYHRADAFDALGRAFPDKSPAEIKRIVRDMYRHLGMNVIESLRLGSMTDAFMEQHIRFLNEERPKQALAEGKGMLVLTAHIGNWEMLCTLTPRLGYPLSIVAKIIKNRALNEAIARIRRQFGLRVLPARNSYRECVKAIRRNEAVGFILDQNMTRDNGEFVEFFGRPACTTLGLAHLAARTGAPILPVFTVRKPGGKHEIHALSLIEPPADREMESLIQATQQYTQVIEEFIRQHPEQWIWLHRRWRTRPPPEQEREFNTRVVARV